MTEASCDVADAADVVCSVRMVFLWAMHEYSKGVAGTEDDAIVGAGCGR